MNEGPFARRTGLRAGAWVLAAASAALLATACSAAGRATPPVQGSSPQIFTMKLAHDHPRLDRGVLTYTDLTTIQVRRTALFNVQVTDVGRGLESTAFTRQLRGRLAAPQDVPTGGVVSVQITCGSGLTCTPRSAPGRQEIFGVGRSGTWAWDVAATSPGNSRILLTAIRYRGNSQTVRTQALVTVGITVRSTPLYAVQAAVDARKGTMAAAAAAAMLAAAGALGAVLALRRRKGRRRASARHANLSSAETVTWPALSQLVPSPRGPVSPPTGPVSLPTGPESLPTGPVPPLGPASPPAGSVPPPTGPASRSMGPVPSSASPVSARRAFARMAWRGRPRTTRPGWLRQAWRGRPRTTRPGSLRQAWPGWPRKAWLGWLAVDIAVGVLALSIVRGTTSKPPAFAIAAAAVAVVVVPVYFLPAFVAHVRRVPDFPSVAVINGVLGWTFFGWVAALALALRDRRPETAVTPRAGGAPPAYPAQVAGSGPGVHEMQRRGADVTLVLWQTPDDSLTCQDPDDAWVSRWTYCVSPGQDGRPQFVLTGERHGCLVGPYPGPAVSRPGGPPYSTGRTFSW